MYEIMGREEVCEHLSLLQVIRVDRVVVTIRELQQKNMKEHIKNDIRSRKRAKHALELSNSQAHTQTCRYALSINRPYSLPHTASKNMICGYSARGMTSAGIPRRLQGQARGKSAEREYIVHHAHTLERVKERGKVCV